MYAGNKTGFAAGLFFFAGLLLAFVGRAYAADPADLAEGREIYELYCGACHGFDGKPLMPGTPNFSSGERLDKDIEELLESINKGKGAVMPSWNTVLNPKECKQVLDFIFSLTGH